MDEVIVAYNASAYIISQFDAATSDINTLHKAGAYAICYWSAGILSTSDYDYSEWPTTCSGTPVTNSKGSNSYYLNYALVSTCSNFSKALKNRFNAGAELGCDGFAVVSTNCKRGLISRARRDHVYLFLTKCCTAFRTISTRMNQIMAYRLLPPMPSITSNLLRTTCTTHLDWLYSRSTCQTSPVSSPARWMECFRMTAFWLTITATWRCHIPRPEKQCL